MNQIYLHGADDQEIISVKEKGDKIYKQGTGILTKRFE